MANTIRNIQEAASVIAKGAAQELKDNLKFVSSIDKVDASDFEGKNGYAAGNKITVNIPARYVPQNTFDITSSDKSSVEEKVSMTLDMIQTVPLEFGSLELATDVGLKSVMQRFVLPAAKSAAQYFEQDAIKRAAQATYNSTGVPGSNSFSVADVLAGRVKLNRSLAPTGDRTFLLDSASGALATDARKGLFQSSEEIAKQYKEGYIGTADGFNWMENELLYTHTNGADVSGVTVRTGSTTGDATLAVQGLTASQTALVKKGSVFTIDGIYKVHPITKKTYPELQQFVVTADADSDGSGYASLSISPSIQYAPSAATKGLQNVSALPTANLALVFVGSENGSYTQNLQFHKSAFRVVTVPLEMPTAVEFSGQETVDGITVQIVRAFDIMQRRMITRLDILGGFIAVRPEWSNRVTA